MSGAMSSMPYQDISDVRNGLRKREFQDIHFKSWLLLYNVHVQQAIEVIWASKTQWAVFVIGKENVLSQTTQAHRKAKGGGFPIF